MMESVQKAFDTNNVAVIITSSDLYAPYVGVLIESIIENKSKNYNYDILVFQTDIHQDTQYLLKKLAENSSNVSVRCIDISFYMDNYKFGTINANHSKYNFYRLTALDILTNYEKIIYFDSDIVVNCDIAELYNFDVNGYYLAATKCIRMQAHCSNPRAIGGMKKPMKEYILQELKMKDYTNYFNSGVMVLNLTELRKSFTSKQLLDISSSSTFATVEQDVLNVLCEGKVKFLNQKWNVLCLKGNGMEQKAPQDLYQEYLEARNDAAVWHYVGNSLPCKQPTVDHYWYFWNYARKTPFYEVLLSRMITELASQNALNKTVNLQKASNNTKPMSSQPSVANRSVTNRTSPPIPKGKKFREFLKKIARKVFPAYRVSLRIEKLLCNIYDAVGVNSGKKSKSTPSTPPKPTVLQRSAWDKCTLTANEILTIRCLAEEIQKEHHKSFSKYKNYYTDNSLVIVATGPSMAYYTQIPGLPHIGVNAAFKNPNIKLDYYFTTDYESRNDWFEDLKNYDFIKFFGQYSVGTYRDRFQVTEKLVEENHAFRFFQGAPSEDIHLNIEHYPLMGFYSIAFQALHFAVYTNPKRIYLVGCDCSNAGYFDGSAQLFANLPKWVAGYKKMKAFVERFYPETEIVSINPIGLRGLFRDVYTESFLEDHPEIDRNGCEILEIENVVDNANKS